MRRRRGLLWGAVLFAGCALPAWAAAGAGQVPTSQPSFAASALASSSRAHADGRGAAPVVYATIHSPGHGRFARLIARSGQLPVSGRPRLGGVQLPAGRPDDGGLALWSSDHPVRHPVQLAERLAAAFPRTGLWPVLWPAWDAPAGYMNGADGVARIGQINASRLLASRWSALRKSDPRLARFGGLAHGVARRGIENPFTIVARHFSQIQADDPGPYLLLLISCRQPADIIDTLGFGAAGIVPGGSGAVLRSWEARFGAYPVMLSPNGRSVFAVQSEPRQRAQARKLAAEILAATGAQQNPTVALRLLTSGVLGSRITLRDERMDPPLTTTPATWGFLLGDT